MSAELVMLSSHLILRILWWRSSKESACPCRRCKRCGFDLWVGKIPRRRKWQPTPVFLPGKSHEQRSLADYSPWGHKELDTTIATSLVAQMVKRLSTMQETQVRSLGREDPLEKEMAIHSSILAWRIPWMERPSWLQSMGLQRVGHD